jgi:hypothetical protein
MAEFEARGLVIVEEFNDGEVSRPSGRMVLNPRFNWFLGVELIKKIIPHTHANFNSDNGNSKRIDLF